jgi:hypothetical protein
MQYRVVSKRCQKVTRWLHADKEGARSKYPLQRLVIGRLDW